MVTNLSKPGRGAGEALVRVDLAGICNTDLELIRGYSPFAGILGHEFVGTVEDCDGPLLGKRVVGEINIVCGHCAHCLGGRSTHCENRAVVGIRERPGVFAEYVVLPVSNLHRIPDELPDEVAVFVEPLAAALQIQEQVEIHESDRVAIVGDGKLGNLIAQTLDLTGCRLTVIGRHEEKLKPLRERGVSTTTDPGSISNVDVVVECTGNAQGFATALNLVRPRGTLVMKSTYRGRLEFDAAAIVVNEIIVVGSRCGPFPPAIDLLKSGKIDVGQLVDRTYPMGEALDALTYAAQPGVMKVLLKPAEGRGF